VSSKASFSKEINKQLGLLRIQRTCLVKHKSQIYYCLNYFFDHILFIDALGIFKEKQYNMEFMWFMKKIKEKYFCNIFPEGEFFYCCLLNCQWLNLVCYKTWRSLNLTKYLSMTGILNLCCMIKCFWFWSHLNQICPVALWCCLVSLLFNCSVLL
jgi:hypothetical protein